MNGFYRFVVRCFNVLYPYKVYGKENVPEGGAVFVCNHFRAIDPSYVIEVYGKDIKILAKNELFKNRLLAKTLKSMGAVPIDRTNPDVKTMLSLIRYLKEGHKVLIFPEGTRNTTGTTELQDLKGGSALFAIKAKVPIVPIMLENKGRFLKKNRIIVGLPFELSEFYGKKTTDEDIAAADDIIKAKMIEAQKNLFEIIAAKKRKNKKNK